ncbi:MAG: ATPase [Lachnospiraceae bacterium]|nr:ATPase [Lachnospiraceae bacterium]MBR5178417.1 ATPase [Lachnospiraceae bacterium]
MSQSRIEEIINELYEYVESAKTNLTQSKIVVQKDDIFGFLDELRLHIPDEIKRCQKIIANRENIIKKANEDAQEIIDEANQKAVQIEEDGKVRAQQLVEETEIMKSAYEQANKMVQNAKTQAEKIIADAEQYSGTIKSGAMNYADDILDTIEKIVSQAYREAKDNSERLVGALKNNLAALQANQDELREAKQSPEGVFADPNQINQPIPESNQNAEYFENPDDDGEYNFPEGTFNNY